MMSPNDDRPSDAEQLASGHDVRSHRRLGGEYPDLLDRVVDEQPHPFVFVTISGAHLYGFASPDSDYDLRGCHVLAAKGVVGLRKEPETFEVSEVREGVELDVVSHDAEKFFGLLLKKNGYVLEQVFSPLVMRTGGPHEELKSIANRCITRHHVHHYLGFARNQWKLFTKEDPPRVKPLLYVYRVLLTGIHLMRTGCIEADLTRLAEEHDVAHLNELIRHKKEGSEQVRLKTADLEFHAKEFERHIEQLEEAGRRSRLRDTPEGRDDLHDLLVRLRLG